MFGLFGSKTKLPAVSDRVWLSDTAKANGLIRDINTSASKNKNLWLLSFFDETTQWLKDNLKQNNIPFIEIVNGQITENQSGASLVIASAQSLLTSAITDKAMQKTLETKDCEIIIPEHYPSHKEEIKVLEKIASLTEKKPTIHFYVSLTEPLMKAFGSERIIEMMEKMGMKEDEMIEHKMVSSAITNAQKKMDTKVLIEKKAPSSQEWFRLNITQ